MTLRDRGTVRQHDNASIRHNTVSFRARRLFATRMIFAVEESAFSESNDHFLDQDYLQPPLRSFSPELRDQPRERPRTANQMNIRTGRILRDRFHKKRAASPPIRHQPPPEVCTLSPSPQCPPSTASEGKIQQDNGIRGPQPDFHGIIRAQVAVDNPALFLDQLLLHLQPLLARRCRKSLPPENFVQLDDRQSSDFAQRHRERRLPRPSATEYDHALHIPKPNRT